MSRTWFVCLALVSLLFLSGCYLASGEQVSTPAPVGEDSGMVSGGFVSADGATDREIFVGRSLSPVQIDVTVEAKWGELVILLLDDSGMAVWSVSARYGRPGEGRTVVTSDEAGLVHYRIRAFEASEGSYTIFYRIQVATPTPLPTPVPTVTPTP